MQVLSTDISKVLHFSWWYIVTESRYVAKWFCRCL